MSEEIRNDQSGWNQDHRIGRSKHENALPLIVTHGWPGSAIEQLKIIEPLTSPEFSVRLAGGWH